MGSFSITAAIPVYNGEQFIGGAVKSLLNQSLPADQILVVDDGSSDRTAQYCRQYPVSLISHETNLGIAAARNTAVRESVTDIIVFIDVDALAEGNLLEVLSGKYTEPDIAGVGGQGIESSIHSTADRWRRAHASQGYGPKEKSVEHLFGLCMSYRATVIKEVGGFNQEFRTNGEDVDIGLRINAAGYRLLYVPQAVVYHQRTDDTSSLMKTMSNWYTAGYRAKKANNAQPWKLYLGVLRRTLSGVSHDLLLERDLDMARLSFRVARAKFQALRTASSS